MMSLFIRLNQNELVNQQSITEYFGNDRYLACFESPSGNPHYHIWYHTSKKADTVRNALSRHFKLKGNGQISVKVKAPTTGINYLCKGDKDDPSVPPVVFGTMRDQYTDKDIDDAHKAVHRWLASKKPDVVAVNHKETLMSQVESAFDRYIQQRRDNNPDFVPMKHVTVDDIERFLMQQFFDWKKHWDTGVIGKYRNYLYYKINPDMCFEYMRINRRW